MGGASLPRIERIKAVSNNTKIEWTDRVWNPVRGCSLVSPGCANCYAMKQAHRFSGSDQPYEGLTEIGPQGARWTGKIRLVSDALNQPLRWKKPCRVFVNSMSDLFHEAISDDFIYRVFMIMARCHRHAFQILTKRPERMNNFCRRISYIETGFNGLKYPSCSYWPNNQDKWPIETTPLPNVWLGVSVEDQQTADERIPLLLQTPAAVRFVSYEPILAAVDFLRWLPKTRTAVANGVDLTLSRPGISWLIAGGESGPKARPCDVAWIHSAVQQ